MGQQARQFAVVTGASSGIGLELARLCIAHNFDTMVVADDEAIHKVPPPLSKGAPRVMAVQCDLSTSEGVQQLMMAIAQSGRDVDALLANAGRGLGRAFLDQSIEEALKVVHTNIDGTIVLIHHVGNHMRSRGSGRILITGSIAGLMPGTFQAVYNGTKAFLDSFAAALANELKDSGVTVTNLMPGATDTEFFERADMLDTKVGASQDKDDPADVARTGFDAMMSGEKAVVHGLKNKIQAAVAHVTPDPVLAEMHRKMAEPGTAKQK